MEDINATPVREEQVTVCIADIKQWLKQGVTRRVGDPGYNAEIGSVQERYDMSKAEVTALFQDSRLKGLKVSTPKPSRIIIAEDIVPVEDVIPSGEGSIPSHGDEEVPVPVQSDTTEDTAHAGSGSMAEPVLESLTIEAGDSDLHMGPTGETLTTQEPDGTAFEVDAVDGLNF